MGGLYIIIIIIIIIGIQPLGRSGQRSEFSQATDMALVRCMLGKFLEVACHCFPPGLYITDIKYINRLLVQMRQTSFIFETHIPKCLFLVIF